MWGTILPAIASQAGNIVGAVLQKKAAEKSDQANKDTASFNAAKQEEFAQHGIRWKVADAKAAGIHPLVGLGASTTSFSPVGVGNVPDSSMANMASNMGQDISRSISATRTADERQMANLQVQAAQLDLQGKSLDNDIKISTLRQMNQTGPAFPGSQGFMPGQGSGAGIHEKPMERTTSMKGVPHSEPGAITDLGWARTATGVVPVPSGDVKQRIEDNMPHEWMHYYRNNIKPNFGGGTKPPKSALPKGATDWEWSFTNQEYQPIYKGKSKTPYSRAQSWYDKNLRWPR